MSRDRFIRVILQTLGILGLVLAGGLLTPVQAATVINPNCGDIIGPGGSFILGGNVGPCGTDPALTVTGPVKLDLGGLTVSCSTTATDGIVINGKAAKVTNGIVSGCGEGVSLEDMGKHTVKELTSQNNSGSGFLVDSNNNKLFGNTSTSNGSEGFDIGGGDSNVLKENMATNNGLSGFLVDTQDNRLIGNEANGNTDDGFFVLDDDNLLRQNTANNNSRHGINVRFSSNERIIDNTATGNTSDDLADNSAGCDNNLWKNNTFGTSSQACIH